MTLTTQNLIQIFSVCAPSLVGAYYLHPPDARAIFLHNDFTMKWHVLCNLGEHNVLGGHKRKRSPNFYLPRPKNHGIRG